MHRTVTVFWLIRINNLESRDPTLIQMPRWVIRDLNMRFCSLQEIQVGCMWMMLTVWRSTIRSRISRLTTTALMTNAHMRGFRTVQVQQIRSSSIFSLRLLIWDHRWLRTLRCVCFLPQRVPPTRRWTVLPVMLVALRTAIIQMTIRCLKRMSQRCQQSSLAPVTPLSTWTTMGWTMRAITVQTRVLVTMTGRSIMWRANSMTPAAFVAVTILHAQIVRVYQTAQQRLTPAAFAAETILHA